MKVFVNITSRDLASFKSALKDLLTEQEHTVSFLEDYSGENTSSSDICKKAIQQNDVFIGIYARLYGEMQRGEETSINEQLHRFAEKNGKDMLTYALDGKADWPDKFQEDDFIKRSRMEAFQKHLRSGSKTIAFKSSRDVISHIQPRLEKLSLIYDRQKHLHNWSKDLTASKKLGAMKGLAERYTNGKMNSDTYRRASALIATDFISESPLPAALADDIEKLLKGDIKAEGITATGKEGSNFWQTLANNVKPVLAAATVLALLLGYFVGTKMAEPETTEVTAEMSDEQATRWFLSSRVENNLTPGAFDQTKMNSAISGLRLARSLPDQQPVSRYLNKLIAEIRSSSAGAADEITLENNKKLLQALCDSLQLETFCAELASVDEQINNFAERSATSSAVQTLMARAENRELAETDRIASYQELLSKYPNDIDKNKVNAQIEWLNEALKRKSDEAAAEAAEAERLAQQKADSIKAAQEAETPVVETTEADVTPADEPTETAEQPVVENEQQAAEEPEEEVPPRDVPDDEAVKGLIALVNSDTLTINDALSAWRELSSTLSGDARIYADEEVGILRDRLKTTANIKKAEDFFLCRDFNLETKEPSGIGDRFNTGKIWMFARVFAPRDEEITAQWISRGRLYHTSKANITTSYGYRVFFSKLFYAGNLGENEVRLFNEDGILIARETFDLVSEPVVTEQDTLQAPAAAAPDSSGNGL
ncbi:MAG: DUF4062 domain-containing protein [Calditrichota bacterium]